MTTMQLKSEIHKAIDNVPENVLPEILKYITAIQHQPVDMKTLKKIADKIFKEDDELLRQLAQ